MAEYAVLNAFNYIGSLDLTPDANAWSLDGTTEVRDKTTFRNTGSRRWKSTLFGTKFSVNGFSDVGPAGNDLATWNMYKARAPQVVTAGNIEAEGQPCVLTQGLLAQLQPGGGGNVGDLGALATSWQGSDPYGGIRGVLLAEQQVVSTTGAKGTAVQHGAVASDERLFATLHLLGTAGTSITAVIESDDNSNFTSATTRYTWSALTAANGYWATPVAGAITDTWWRLRVTAVSGSWTVAAAIGIE